MIENHLSTHSRPIINRGWLQVFVHLLAFSSVSAQVPAGSQDNQNGLYSNFDPSMAIVIVILIFAFFVVGMCSIFIRQCTEAEMRNNSAIRNAAAAGVARRSGLDPAVIEMFPVFLYSRVKEIKIGKETLECAICLNEFEDDETLRLLPKCNHVFHPDCIDMWLASHITCPVCRARLTPESCKTHIVTPSPQQPTTTEPNSQNAVPEVNEPQDEVVISVNEESAATAIINTSQFQNLPPRLGTSAKFPRSHSTGHSLVLPGEKVERYTLRLPEEVKRHIMETAGLKRAMSFNVILHGEGSSRKGYHSGEGSSRGRQIDRSDRWWFLMNPLFVSRGGSVKSCKVDNDGDSNNGKRFLGSVKVPLNCLNMRAEGVEEPSSRSRPSV